jgi:hypothetical protein
MAKLNMTCKKGKTRGRRRPSAEGDTPAAEGLKMSCECEPVGAKMGIGGCEYPPRTRSKRSMIHGTKKTEKPDTDAC